MRRTLTNTNTPRARSRIRVNNACDVPFYYVLSRFVAGRRGTKYDFERLRGNHGTCYPNHRGVLPVLVALLPVLSSWARLFCLWPRVLGTNTDTWRCLCICLAEISPSNKNNRWHRTSGRWLFLSQVACSMTKQARRKKQLGYQNTRRTIFKKSIDVQSWYASRRGSWSRNVSTIQESTRKLNMTFHCWPNFLWREKLLFMKVM